MNTVSVHPTRSGAIALFCGFLLLMFPALADNSLAKPAQAATSLPEDLSDVDTDVDTESNNVGDLIRVGSTALLGENETCNNVVVVGGTATIRGSVMGDLVVVGGNAEVFNHVNGDLVIVGGTATLSPQVRVRGDLIAVGGKIFASKNIIVGGQRLEIAPFLGTMFSSAGFYVQQCLFKGRLISGHLPGTVAIFIAFMMLGFLLAMLFSRTFAKAALVTSEKPGIALLMGFLSVLAAGPIIIALIATVIGIPVAPVFMLLLAGLALIGVTGVYAAIGRRILEIFGSPSTAVVVPVLIGAGITMGLAMTPWIGAITIALIFTVGIGAGVYGFFERIRENRPSKKIDIVNSTAQPYPTSTVQPRAEAQPGRKTDSTGATDQAPLHESEACATMWSRLGAALIDMLLIFMVYGLTLGAITDFNGEGSVRVLCLLVYLTVMWFWKGTTIGNIVFHLQVRRTDDTKLTLGVAVVRALSLVLSIAPLGLGFFWIRWDPNHQAWHDTIAGTKVVKVSKGASLL